jgi:phosphoribosylformimino-5-aminoimidazole carboxamide ribotide isomerase
MEVVPAIDLLGGGIVRLFQGDFEQVTEYARDPLKLAGRYARGGMKRLHVVDLVSRAVIGSVAVNQRELVAEWIAEVGVERIILAFDVRLDDSGAPETLTHGWTRGSGNLLWPLVEYFLQTGAREFLCTDIARDGTLNGPNLTLYRECVARYPDAEFIASGGVSCLADLEALDQIGVARVVTGKALLDGRLDIEEIERFSRGA